MHGVRLEWYKDGQIKREENYMVFYMDSHVNGMKMVKLDKKITIRTVSYIFENIVIWILHLPVGKIT